jgi:hypothetical protein
MAIKFNRSQTFATNGTVTSQGLHNLIDDTDIYQALITDQTAMTSVGSSDKLLIADADLTAADAPRSVTVNELFEDALTLSTYTNVKATNVLYTNATGNYTVSTSATITTGTIPNLTSSTANITLGTIPTLTAGTTTSTAANITNGTVQTLTASTANISQGSAILTQGTIATLNSTTGTIGALNSTTGTIGNLSTTLAGDFTISSGTGTLGTTGVTAGTYGSASAIPFITVDAKGRITSATSGTFSSTPPANSVTFNTLSTSSTEADNVASRVAKAWVNFNGTGVVAIQASFNVSSITDNTTGDYTVNFATALVDEKYTVAGTVKFVENDGASTVFGMSISNRASNPTASAVRIVTGQANNSTQFDMLVVTVAIHR